ncbi:hypothetical protein HOA55_03645 [archaeon]|jgi:hypothetical protein|nr:hypothetical protein [archaeon]MBT3577334.1 hypothetical protein [archaeon]MBT6820422.1 hypothetical protein [archaeon]MBT6956768.1 hypothetical protein [archaeon]MBT7025236.1 hypothetical protein [archaeon]
MGNEPTIYYVKEGKVIVNKNRSGELQKEDGSVISLEGANYVSPKERRELIEQRSDEGEFRLTFKDLISARPYDQSDGTLLLVHSINSRDPYYLVLNVIRREPPFSGDSPFVDSVRNDDPEDALAALAAAEDNFEKKQARRAAARERKKNREAEEGKGGKK